jgi:hypothetical protein
MATSYTPNYKLDLYTDTDKPNLRDQYNGAMNKIDSQFTTVSNNIVVAIEAANQAKEKADSASDSAATNAQSIATLNNTVSGIDTAYKAADSSIIEAYKAADAKLSSDITSAYKAADSEIETAYKAADSALAARFPIKSADIADGAITESKLSADLLKPTNSGISASDNLKVLYIGDSYGVATSYNTQTPIPMAIQNITNWTVTNDSKGSRGYIAKGNGGDNRNFQETINSYSGEYDLIIIAGGRNDAGYTTDDSSAEYTAALNCFNTAHSKFPNAKIVAVPMLWHDSGLTSSASNAYIGIVSAAKYAIGTYCVEGAQSWGLDFTNWQEGGIHPDTSIAESYARHIVNAICTNFNGWVSYNKHVSVGSNCDLYFAYSHGLYSVNGTIKGNYTLAKSNMPHWFAPKVSSNNFTANVLTSGGYCAVFIDQNSVSVFGTPDADALVNWNSGPFGIAE